MFAWSLSGGQAKPKHPAQPVRGTGEHGHPPTFQTTRLRPKGRHELNHHPVHHAPGMATADNRRTGSLGCGLAPRRPACAIASRCSGDGSRRRRCASSRSDMPRACRPCGCSWPKFAKFAVVIGFGRPPRDRWIGRKFTKFTPLRARGARLGASAGAVARE